MYKENKGFCLHPLCIETYKRVIYFQIFDYSYDFINNLTMAIISKQGSHKQLNHILVAADILERIARLAYRNKAGKYVKLKEEEYRLLFDANADCPEEIYDMMARMSECRTRAELIARLAESKTKKRDNSVYLKKTEYAHKLIWQIADIVCPMIACEKQVSIRELEYAIRYVIEQKEGDFYFDHGEDSEEKYYMDDYLV